MFNKFRDSRPGAVSVQPPETEVSPLTALATDDGEAPPHSDPEGQRNRRRKLTEIRQLAHQEILETLNLAALLRASETEIKSEIAQILRDLLPHQAVALSRADRDGLIDELFHEVMGHGPLEILIRDDSVSDILINGPEQVYVEQGGLLELTDVQFQDEAHLRRILQKIVSSVGRRLDESTPYVDARLSDGSRVNAVIAPVAVDGTLVSIRKFRRDKLSLEQLATLGAMNEKMALYLRAAVSARLNVIVSGGTGSGKTTLLNALSAFISRRERIITVEDTAELQLQQSHVGRMESRPPNVEGKGEVTQRDCLRNALRMRPDRIIIGETRGDEVIDMLQAMNTGHDGSMTTIHANSAREAASRIENMVAMAGIEIPLSALRRQIAGAVHLIVQVNRLQDGSRKVTSVTEITGCEGDVISMQELFWFEQTGLSADNHVEGQFRAAGVRSFYTDLFRRRGITLPAEIYGA